MDISQEADVEHMVSVAVELYGRLDILINNAARFVFASARNITDEGVAAFRSTFQHVASCKSSLAAAACWSCVQLEVYDHSDHVRRLGSGAGDKCQRHLLCN